MNPGAAHAAPGIFAFLSVCLRLYLGIIAIYDVIIAALSTAVKAAALLAAKTALRTALCAAHVRVLGLIHLGEYRLSGIHQTFLAGLELIDVSICQAVHVGCSVKHCLQGMDLCLYRTWDGSLALCLN